MCGLNGIFAYKDSADSPSRGELLATREYMIKRGPDGAGEWWDGNRRIGLGHRRLSIIDLSDRAAQPMVSACGRFVVVFNGEIYNYPELRSQLEIKGRIFRTNSDTEILLHLYALFGEQMVHRLRGMFAFAIWDEREKSVFLARDPYGIKPLYTADDGQVFRFSSQVKAMLAGGIVSRDPEAAGVVGFYLWGSVPEPFTMYREIRALPAGHTQLINSSGARPPTPYCSISRVLALGDETPAQRSEINERVRDAALQSVTAHLLADVDVGLFLSAGVDSGALLGLMRDAGHHRVKAVTLTFEEFRGTSEDESILAAHVADAYGAEHIVRTVTEEEFTEDLPKILGAMDQPSIDGVNTWFVSKAASEVGLKVALSGVGGDELLGGYPSFRQVPRCVSWLRIPSAIPGAASGARTLMKMLGFARSYPKALGLLQYGGTYAGAYLLRRSLFLPFELETVLDPGLVAKGLKVLEPVNRVQSTSTPTPSSPIGHVAALESSNYMRNQLLRDADWAGMAHSLEIRTPLVDIELLRSISPVTRFLTGDRGKRALAAAPRVALPPEITERPKTGFVVPTGRWIAIANAQTAGSKGAASRAWASQVIAAQPCEEPAL